MKNKLLQVATMSCIAMLVIIQMTLAHIPPPPPVPYECNDDRCSGSCTTQLVSCANNGLCSLASNCTRFCKCEDVRLVANPNHNPNDPDSSDMMWECKCTN